MNDKSMSDTEELDWPSTKRIMKEERAQKSADRTAALLKAVADLGLKAQLMNPGSYRITGGTYYPGKKVDVFVPSAKFHRIDDNVRGWVNPTLDFKSFLRREFGVKEK